MFCDRVKGRGRPVQKHKRTQDWRAGPFRSSLPRGEPQIWGVSEAMSAIRVLRTRRENNVQQGDATLPGGDLNPGPGPHLDQNVLAGYATVALASILDPSGGLFFRRCTARSVPVLLLGANVALEKSRLETNPKNEACSALLARLW